jgi:hypothetical protein
MKAQLSRILAQRYRCTILTADLETLVWAAARCDEPRKVLELANSVLRKAGRPTVPREWM